MKIGRLRSSESIPFDLIIEILTRLPAKSIARFRCVSKLWDSTLNTPNFTESFFTISSSRPKLLFTCLKDGKTFFFTSSQPQSSSSSLTANFHMSFVLNWCFTIARPLRGLVFGISIQGGVYIPLLCNPSTGQFLALDDGKTRVGVDKVCVGYDPIDKQYKVLVETDPRVYEVITLGTEGKPPTWRRIECDIPHTLTLVAPNSKARYLACDDICINGVCYYFASLDLEDYTRVIISFDIRCEKFKSIRQPDQVRSSQQTLVNYKGKLAKLRLKDAKGIHPGFRLWVLEDAEKHEWSSYIYHFPPPWNGILAKNEFSLVGATGATEIVLSSNTLHDSFSLLYYNTERNTIRRVEIQGMEAFRTKKIFTFLDHAEDLKLMPSTDEFDLFTHHLLSH